MIPTLLTFTNEHRIAGNNADTTRHNNRAMVLKIIKNNKIISRTELVSLTGLTLATITMIVDEFLQEGIVYKAGLIGGNNGRRIMGFSITKERFYTISIRLSVSYLVVGLFDIYSNIIEITKDDFDTLEDVHRTFDKINDRIAHYQEKLPYSTLLGIALGIQGPFIFQDGQYVIPKRKGSKEIFNFYNELSAFYKVPILVDRSSNNLAYNLWINSLFKDTSSFWFNTKHKSSSRLIIYVDVSYTIECGIVANGEIINSTMGCVGNIGNIIVHDKKNGYTTLNDTMATGSIIKKVIALLPEYPNSELCNLEQIKIRNIIYAFNNADPLARYVYTQAGKDLGIAVANIVSIINPDEIYFGDELPNNDTMLNIIVDEAKKYIRPDIFERIIWDMVRVERCVENDATIITGSKRITDQALDSLDYASLKGIFEEHEAPAFEENLKLE